MKRHQTIPYSISPNRFGLKLLIILSLLTATAFSQSTSNAQASSTQMWADGNATGVYLAIEKTRDEQQGFQIYFRGKTSDQFIPGHWYAGQPLAVVFHNQRLLVFLQGGYCQSYDLNSSRTERRLPTGLVPVACTTQGGNLLVLAKTTQPIHIESINTPSVQSQTPNDDTSDSISLDQDAWTILSLGPDYRWKSYSNLPLPIDRWFQPTMIALNDQLHLFGIAPADSASPHAPGQLVHAQIMDHRLSEPQPIPFDRPLAATPIIVNKQLRLLIQSDAVIDSTTEVSEATSIPSRQHTLAWKNNGSWNFSDPLQRQTNSKLITGANNFCVAGIDQVFVAIERPERQKIFYGFYRSDGQIEQPLTQPLQFFNHDINQWAVWITGPKSEMIVIFLVLTLLYIKRYDAFFDLSPLPASFEPAPFWRRGLAWLLDFFPVTLIGWLITIQFYPELKTLILDQNILLVPPQSHHEFLVHEAIAICFLITTALFVIYQILCESLLGASPGKKVFRLHIIDYKGHLPQRKQIVYRNIFRLLEILPMVILLLLLFTRRRQRIGDLMGQTIVVVAANNTNAKPTTPTTQDQSEEPQNDFDS